MPSPRSVLNDIMTSGLDPTKPHSDVGGNGHLRQNKKIEQLSADVPDVLKLKSSVPDLIENESVMFQNDLTSTLDEVGPTLPDDVVWNEPQKVVEEKIEEKEERKVKKGKGKKKKDDHSSV